MTDRAPANPAPRRRASSPSTTGGSRDTASPPEPNWVDEGAISLGIASYAVLDGDEALVYDTHVSVEHGRAIREALEAEGARGSPSCSATGTSTTSPAPRPSPTARCSPTARTAALLAEHREAIEAGTLEGPPAISPLVLPTGPSPSRDGARGRRHRRLELIQVDIHSDDAVVVWDPEARLLLAGDTVEDTVTYVDEPRGLREPPARPRPPARARARRASSPPTATRR